MQRYNPKDIEQKWQEKWAEERIYEATENADKPKKYVLEYFPYPSGAAMHVGHVRNYTIGDAVARHARMKGFNVLHPMGWDAFGLPAENYAIKNNISPQQAIAENTSKFKRQLMQMGFSYDWSREINSSDPSYYKWTQWFFELLFERGLAYQKDSLQWWCDFDKTVLANEQVEGGKCWRCGNPVTKKALKQWFFKITDYADRLSDDLEKLDWSEAIKSMQRNWIGKSQGAEIDFKVEGHDGVKIKVFTTRPDTIYGATFMVLAPEHPLVERIMTDEHKHHVTTYVKAAQQKTDVERQETDREKTGVFTGAYAINPANGEKIPIWVADYVLYGYGTGAIMAVPAHDERDHAFAEKFDLPIVQVVARYHEGILDDDSPQPDVPTRNTAVVDAVITDGKGKYLLQIEDDAVHFAGGGIEESDESPEAAVRREVTEETGYSNITSVKPIGSFRAYFGYRKLKQRNNRTWGQFYEVVVDPSVQVPSEVDEGLHQIKWVDAAEVPKLLNWPDHQTAWQNYLDGVTIDADVRDGVMVNSGEFDGLNTAEAKQKIVDNLAKDGAAKAVTNYKIRDWLISRQRYWGAPIPIIHCPDHGAVLVPKDQLPVVLPEVESYQPTGEGTSVLASVEDWVNVPCPTCDKPAKRETDTMDGFACSSWYFLRFADPHNDKEPFSQEKVKFWLPVDDYIGGAEHAVMHLLYARMWTKVMFDAGMIDFDEPFTSLRNHGMILAPDGRKMSKSWGNTITPDEIIDQGYGADAIRVMELFIGPWDQMANWSVEGMGGCYRFLNRVWTLVQEHLAADKSGEAPLAAVHKTTKKVTEDLEAMGFNTAIAALMELVNDLYKAKTQGLQGDSWRGAIETLLQLLAPFAPHVTEELWQQLGHDDSIHASDWPTYDEKYLVASTVTIAVQVNGKLRATLELPADATEEQTVEAAKNDSNVAAYLGGKTVSRAIYVPHRLVNLVVT
jgi:leucyl-tRNA synthetase